MGKRRVLALLLIWPAFFAGCGKTNTTDFEGGLQPFALAPGQVQLTRIETKQAGVLPSQAKQHAVPCLDPSLLPEQAKVPCHGIVHFEEGLSLAERQRIITGSGAEESRSYRSVAASAAKFAKLSSLESLRSHPQVRAIIPDRVLSAFAKGGNKGQPDGDPDPSPTLEQQVPSGVAAIGAAPGALGYLGSGIGVAVVDTGLDFAHLDITVSSSCFTAYDDCSDSDGHGTHVGGTIAALDNNQDVLGVAPGATLYAVKVLDDDGLGTDSSIIAGLDWIAVNAASLSPAIRVINLSLGRPGALDDNPVLRTVTQLVHSLGISIIVAAGNDPSREVAQMVPAGYPEVIAVASSTAEEGSNRCRRNKASIRADTASYFSTDGAYDETTRIGVTISAPGERRENVSKSCFVHSEGILSLQSGGGTTRKSGSSMAAPHVAGLVALLLEKNGTLGPEAIRAVLRSSARGVGQSPFDSPTSSYSFDSIREGVLSACQALGLDC